MNLSEHLKYRTPELLEFEKEAEKLLTDGGIKNKSVNVIKETSKVIRDKIDNKLEVIFDRN